jgi:HTH-type transcriptional regulator/antitoxin HigA
MIKNSKQAAIAKSNLLRLQKDKKEIINKKTEFSALKFNFAIESLNGLIQDLAEEIERYEKLISNGFHCFENMALQDISEILISSRLAQSISQKELANNVGIQAQQIQRYELTDYEGASLTRLLEVSDALNIQLIFKDIQILGKQLDFILPTSVNEEEVHLLEARTKEKCSLVFN